MTTTEARSVVSTAPSSVRHAVKESMVRIRRNTEHADIDALRHAYAKMQARSEADNRSWIYWASYHGFNRWDCWHHGAVGNQRFTYDLFLPWHRAYLYSFERVVLGDNPHAVLPWWDWTSALSHQNGLPAAFTAPAPNPLASGPVPSGLRTTPNRTTRSPAAPSQLPTKATIESILNLTTFGDFSSQLQNQHDMVHGWTGGDMGTVPASAFDPVFYSHHCMIDRLWHLWQLRHGVDNVPPGYLDRPLAPWAFTVRDVLDIRHLGYDYGVSRIHVPAPHFTASELVDASH